MQKIVDLERECALGAHINLLRAKENGKNCYFFNQNNIDASDNNKEMAKLTMIVILMNVTIF